MRRAHRQDENHGEIVATFEAHGFDVTSASSVGNGFPDLIVTGHGWNGPVWFLAEVKDGAKPPSARRLTDAQLEFRKRHPKLNIFEVLCVEDVRRLVGNLKNPMGQVANGLGRNS